MKYPSRSPCALTGLLIATSAFLGACGSSGGDPTAATGATSASSTGGAGGGAGSAAQGTGGAGGVEPPPPPLMRKTLSGDITWKVTFDAEAQAAGATDCSYTRHYEGSEDTSAAWLCPECEVMFLADVKMTAGQTDCFPQVSTTSPSITEWIGYGAGKFWRGVGGPMTGQGAATVGATMVTMANVVPPAAAPKGGMLGFDVTGALTPGEKEGDPRNGWIPPATYACGWPKADPPAYTGKYALKVGDTLPDGLFHDACGETVRLHDFKGSYLIVDMSAVDCPPCKAMAGAEEQFIADMAAQGIKVNVITLLAPSLNNVVGLTTTKTLSAWITKYQLKTPVLADRGWGLSTFGVAIGDMVGYPSLALVDPNLKVLQFESGFGSFDTYKTAILADAK
jgi:peroxiredoxin